MKASSLITSSGRGGHSARVTMRLLVNGFSLPVLQMGEDFLLMDQPVNHPPVTASLMMRVDESERQWSVRLPAGLSAQSNRVAIETVA